MVTYKVALHTWGALRLEYLVDTDSRESVLKDSVTVKFDFDEGYACCGGSDPNCYCSFAESPSANVVIRARTTRGRDIVTHIDAEDFDFAQVLAEIVTAGGGTISA